MTSGRYITYIYIFPYLYLYLYLYVCVYIYIYLHSWRHMGSDHMIWTGDVLRLGGHTTELQVFPSPFRAKGDNPFVLGVQLKSNVDPMTAYYEPHMRNLEKHNFSKLQWHNRAPYFRSSEEGRSSYWWPKGNPLGPWRRQGGQHLATATRLAAAWRCGCRSRPRCLQGVVPDPMPQVPILPLPQKSNAAKATKTWTFAVF